MRSVSSTPFLQCLNVCNTRAVQFPPTMLIITPLRISCSYTMPPLHEPHSAVSPRIFSRHDASRGRFAKTSVAGSPKVQANRSSEHALPHDLLGSTDSPSEDSDEYSRRFRLLTFSLSVGSVLSTSVMKEQQDMDIGIRTKTYPHSGNPCALDGDISALGEELYLALHPFDLSPGPSVHRVGCQAYVCERRIRCVFLGRNSTRTA